MTGTKSRLDENFDRRIPQWELDVLASDPLASNLITAPTGIPVIGNFKHANSSPTVWHCFIASVSHDRYRVNTERNLRALREFTSRRSALSQPDTVFYPAVSAAVLTPDKLPGLEDLTRSVERSVVLEYCHARNKEEFDEQEKTSTATPSSAGGLKQILTRFKGPSSILGWSRRRERGYVRLD